MKIIATTLGLLLAAGTAHAEPPRICPASVGVVQPNIGPAAVYLGADPADPEACRMMRGGAEKRFWFGVWDTEWPGADAARIALRQVFAGPPGTVARFDTIAAPGYAWHETLRHDGFEDLRVLGTVFHTMKVSHEREGFDGNTYHSIITSWRDIETGMTVYRNYIHIGGHPEPGGWDPVSIAGGK